MKYLCALTALVCWSTTAQFNLIDPVFIGASTATATSGAWTADVAAAKNSATGTTLTVTISPTANSLVVVWICYRNDISEAITSVTDDGATGGSTYVAAFNTVNHATHYTLATFYSTAAKSGITTITVTVPTSGRISAIARSYIKSSPTIDQTSAKKASSSTTPNSNSATTTGSSNLLIGYAFGDSSGANYTADSPWTLVSNQDDTVNGAELAAEEQLNVAAGAATANFTGASANWACYIVNFK